MRAEVAERIEREGFAIVPEAVPDAELGALLPVFATHVPDAEPRRRGGTRNLFESVPEGA